MYGPDPMHTLSNEVKACFSMLGGSVYSGTTKAAQIIKDYEADNNKRYIPSMVSPCIASAKAIMILHTLWLSHANADNLTCKNMCRILPRVQRN